MKQLERLKQIYLALNLGPQTIESLRIKLEREGVSVSSRQLYRDIEDVNEYFLKPDERLEQRSLEFNRKVYLINKHTDAIPITNFDIDTYLLGVATTPMGLINGRKGSLQKIQMLVSSHLSNSKIEHSANWDGNVLTSTHFFEMSCADRFQTFLGEILWATLNRRSLEVISYDGDAVSLYKSLTFPFVFNPLKLIYHRGSFYVAGIIAETKQCLVIDAFQISTYKLTNETFPVKSSLGKLEKDLANRFGITQNIDTKTYHIVLEISSETGKYLKMFSWHHSQVFEEMPSGNWKLELTCGINRELLGWIFQFTGNVKVIAPDILKTYHAEKWKMIGDVQQSDVINYSNIMQPR